MQKEQLNIYIVDDDLAFQRILELNLHELGFKNLYFATSFQEGLARYLEVDPDFAFIDIHFPNKKNGIELAKNLIKLKKIPFAFITSNFNPNTYELAKEIAPTGFLDKDFSPLELLQTIELPLAEYRKSYSHFLSEESSIDENFLFIKLGPVLHRIKWENILYFQTAGNYAEVITEDRKFLTNYSVKQVGNIVPKDCFIRINQSQLVNKNKINQVNTEKNEILIDKLSLSLSRRYKKEILNKINRL